MSNIQPGAFDLHWFRTHTPCWKLTRSKYFPFLPLQQMIYKQWKLLCTKVVTLSLQGTLLSVLLFERSVLTLYVKEKVGANEGEYHHRDRQSTVRHHLSDFGIQIRAVGEATHISTLWLCCNKFNRLYYCIYSSDSLSLENNAMHVKYWKNNEIPGVRHSNTVISI